MKRLKHPIKSRWKSNFAKGSIIVGLLSIFISWLMYKNVTNTFLYDAYQSLLAFGIILFVTGIIFILFGVKEQ